MDCTYTFQVGSWPPPILPLSREFQVRTGSLTRKPASGMAGQQMMSMLVSQFYKNLSLSPGGMAELPPRQVPRRPLLRLHVELGDNFPL